MCLFPTKEENKIRSQIPDTYPVPFKFPATKKLRYGLGVFNYDKLNCPSSIVFIILIEFILSKTIKEA